MALRCHHVETFRLGRLTWMRVRCDLDMGHVHRGEPHDYATDRCMLPAK